MKRRPIILLLIGTIAALAGSVVIVVLRQNRCDGEGGRYDAAIRRCQLEGGDYVSVGAASDVFAGLVIAVLLAFMLVRIFLVATGRVAPESRTSRSTETR